MKFIIYVLGIFSYASSSANSPIGLLSIDKIKQSRPYIDKEHVRVWNAKLTESIRINVIEFSGEIPMHKHPDAGHNLLVLKGEISVLLGKTRFTAKEGSFIFIPKAVAHKYWTLGESALLLSMDAPYYDHKKTIKLE